MEDKNFFWKNFKLNLEFHIAGGFIYDGLRIFNQMQFFTEEDTFGFLYNISVGIERLEKILIIVSHKNIEEQNLLQKIKTHDHLKLFEEIKKNHTLNIESKHKKFLYLLSEFYREIRYDKLNPGRHYYNTKEILIDYMTEVGINIDTSLFKEFINNDHIKRRIGEIIGKISSSLYDKIREYKGIYPTETDSHTKAYKIFYEKNYNFFNETLLMKEIIISLLHYKKGDDYLDFIKKEIKPINFESALIEDYIKSIDTELANRNLLDTMNYLYEEMSKKERKKRLEMLSFIERIESSEED